MTTQYLIEPNPVWAFLDLNGLPAAGGFIYTYEANNHAIPKPVYQNNDSNNLVPWPNPITLDSTGKQSYLGTCFPIFWADDVPYYVVITDVDGNIIFDGSGFPWTASNAPIITETDIENYFINPQFYFNYGQIINANGDVGFNDLPASDLAIAPDNWGFYKNNTSATDTIIFGVFDPGEIQVPNNPKAYVEYNCTIPGSSETSKSIYYKFKSVRQFAGETINIQFYAQSSLSSQLSLYATQYFGVGGSTTVPISIATQTLTPNLTLYQFTIQINSIATKTIGPGGDDYLEINFGSPLNTVANIVVANACLRFGSTFVDIQEQSVNITSQQVTASTLPALDSVNWIDGNYTLESVQNTINQPNLAYISHAAEIVYWPVNTSPTYGTSCNGFPFYQYEHYNLAQRLWDTNQSKLPWGSGPSGFTTSLSTATITATCFSNGTVTSGSEGTTPFTYAQTNNGSSSTQGVATILCTAGSTITPGMYFLMNSAIDNYYYWLSLNNNTVDPILTTSALSGKKGIKISYTGSETDVQLAALVQLQINLTQVRVPDFRGLFIRMWAQGVESVLTSYTNVLITSAGDDTGITFAISGFDDLGNAISENLTGANAGIATSTNKYQGLLSIIPSGNTAAAITVGDSNSATGVCLSQSGTAATALLLNGPYQRDPDYLTRGILYVGGGTGDNVGSNQASQILSHNHQETGGTSGGSTNLVSRTTTNTSNTSTDSYTNNSGGKQSNPNNVYANALILF